MTGEQLIADINAWEGRLGELALWWLGQHSFVVKLGRAVVYLDPFLTALKGRQIPPLLAPEEVANADLISGSHDHADHIDRPAWPVLAKASPKAKFILPELLRERVARELSLPAERLLGLDDGKTVSHAGVTVSAVPAAHEFLDQDPATGQYPFLGFIVSANGCTLYHAGDCCNYEGLQTRLRRWKFDLAILPINGRDAERYAANCIGNMTYQEAADLAGVLQPRLTIPAHWDMFAMNPGDPAAFSDYMRVKYPHLKVHVCEHGARLVLPPQ